MSTQLLSLLPLLGNYHRVQLKHIADSRRRPKLVQGKRYAAFERDLNTFSAVGLCGLSFFCLAPVAAGFSLALVDLCGIAALFSPTPCLVAVIQDPALINYPEPGGSGKVSFLKLLFLKFSPICML